MSIRTITVNIAANGSTAVGNNIGVEGENNATTINVRLDAAFDDYNKRIEFKSANLPEPYFTDILGASGDLEFSYDIPSSLTRGLVMFQVVCVKSDNSRTFKTIQYVIEFREAINASSEVPPGAANILDVYGTRISNMESAVAEFINTYVGPAGTIAINQVTTLAPGASVTIENVGTPQNALLNIGIPQGQPGTNISFGSSFISSLPSSPVLNVLYPFAGANGGSVSGGTIKDIDGTTIITTLQNGDYVQYKTTYWQRIMSQSVNYQAINITPNFDIFINRIKLTHPRNPDELNGNQTYNTATARAYGYINYIDSQIIFNKVKCTIFDTATEDITIKIFERSNTNSFDYATETALHTQNISGVDFPKSYISGGTEFALNTEVTVASGKYLFIVFCTTSGNNSSTLSIRQFDNNSTGDRSPFYFALNNNTLFASALPNYAQTSVILSLYKNYKNTEITLKEYIDNMNALGVSYDNLISGITATTVKGAIDELKSLLAGLGVADNILATLNVDYYVEEYGSEKILNGGFELGTGNAFTNWTDVYGNAIAETSLVKSGSRALKLTDSDAVWYNPQLKQNANVIAGEVYELKFYTRGDGANDAVFAIYNNTGFAYIIGTQLNGGVLTGITGTTYQLVTVRFTIPTGCSSIGIWLFVKNVIGATCYYDDISLKKVSIINKNGIPTNLNVVLNNIPSKAFKFNNSGTNLSSTNTEDAIKEINTKIIPSVEISLPDTIYAIVGDKLQLFFIGIIKAINPYNYDILVTCTKGAKYPRYFEYTPVAGDIGTTTFKIDVRDKDGVVLGTKTVNLITKSAVQSPSSVKKVLCVGDSLTGAGTWCQEASRRLIGTGGTPAGLALSNIQFLGRKTGGGIGWEGTGGWTWSSYATAGATAYKFVLSGVVTPPAIGATYTNNSQVFTVSEVNLTGGIGYISATTTGAPTASGSLIKTSGTGDSTLTFSSSTLDAGNPFWETDTNSLDFTQYVNTYMGGACDVIYFLLTWNGVTANQTNFSSMITTAKILIDHIHTNYANCKIKIMGIQVPSLNGGIGANYGAIGSGYADNFGMVKTALNMNTAYQNWCNESAYSSFCEFVNISSQFDSENNMPQADVAVNSRSVITEKRGTNGVHPDTSGYYQIADVVFRNFVANFCQ